MRLTRCGGESSSEFGQLSLLVRRVKSFQNDPTSASSDNHRLTVEHFVEKLAELALGDAETNRFHKANLRSPSTFASWSCGLRSSAGALLKRKLILTCEAAHGLLVLIHPHGRDKLLEFPERLVAAIAMEMPCS
jgi:hypothetical protein